MEFAATPEDTKFLKVVPNKRQELIFISTVKLPLLFGQMVFKAALTPSCQDKKNSNALLPRWLKR